MKMHLDKDYKLNKSASPSVEPKDYAMCGTISRKKPIKTTTVISKVNCQACLHILEKHFHWEHFDKKATRELELLSVVGDLANLSAEKYCNILDFIRDELTKCVLQH